METKAHWLRSEIEKLEGMKKMDFHTGQCIDSQDGCEDCFKQTEIDGHNTALTSIITRYKEELLELENVK